MQQFFQLYFRYIIALIRYFLLFVFKYNQFYQKQRVCQIISILANVVIITFQFFLSNNRNKFNYFQSFFFNP